jgi:hypothetical protein
MPMLIIVGNGVEAGNFAPSDMDQLSTRSKHAPKKVGDVGSSSSPSYRKSSPGSSHAC